MVLFLQADAPGTMTLVFDLLIAIAYFCIPLQLLYCFVWFPFRIRAKPAVIGSLFVSFITACGVTHLVRAFNFADAIPIVTGICTVISLMTAIMLLWLIPGMFKLARSLEKERTDRLMLESLRAALREAVEGPEDKKAVLDIIRSVPFCSNRQLRLLTAAKSSLIRMLGTHGVDIISTQNVHSMHNKVVVPINQVVAIVADADVHADHSELLERVGLQIAQLFTETGDMILG